MTTDTVAVTLKHCLNVNCDLFGLETLLKSDVMMGHCHYIQIFVFANECWDL